MTILTDALNRIMSWLEYTHPNDVGLFFPGIDGQEVDEIIQTIPNDECYIFPEERYISLPSELYELYKWRNGYTFYRAPLRDEVDSFMFRRENSNMLDVFDGKSFFPLSETTIIHPLEINSPCLSTGQKLANDDEEGVS